LNHRPVVITLAVLAIVGSCAWLYVKWPGRGPAIRLDSYQALGQVAAEETDRLLAHQGRVVLIAHHNPAAPNPVEEAQLKAFRGALKRIGGVSVAALETFSLTPMEQMSTGGSVPRERFLEVLRAHPKVQGLVLFVAYPALQSADLDQLKRTGMRIILISGYRPGYKRLLETGLLHLAIVPRLDERAEPSQPPRTVREWFDRDYMVVTPDKTPAMPY
jgi:hypothetical protein